MTSVPKGRQEQSGQSVPWGQVVHDLPLIQEDAWLYSAWFLVIRPGLVQPHWIVETKYPGVSWRPEAVAFDLIDSNEYDLLVQTSTVEPEPITDRRIRVPFTVSEDGLVDLGDPSGMTRIRLDRGPYMVLFEEDWDELKIRVTFVPGLFKAIEIMPAPDHRIEGEALDLQELWIVRSQRFDEGTT